MLLAGCSPKAKRAYSNENNKPVLHGVAAPFMFEIYKETKILKIRTYHWNDAKGVSAGFIILSDKSKKEIGRWQADSKSGKKETNSVLWEVEPDQVITPGVYYITTTDLKSWSFNTESNNAGFTSIYIQE
jgi:hypothetical protein